MKHSKLFVTTLLLAVGGVLPVVAQTDVTTQYLQNPSFELSAENTNLTSVQKASNAVLSIYGWTETWITTANQYFNSEIVDESTDNSSNYGKRVKPSDGNYYFFTRQGWHNNTNIKLTSNEFTLAAGKYKLSVDYKHAYGTDNDNQKNSNTKLTLSFNSGDNSVSSATSPAAPQNPGENYFNTADWQTLETSFEITEDTKGTVVIDMAVRSSKRSDFVIDNVRLLGVDLAYFKNQFNTKKTEAENLMNDATYNYIKGEERTKIKTIIEGTYTTIDDYENAVNDLNTAISTFKSALTNYTNLEAAKALIENRLPYASTAKYTALEAAKNCEEATSASDADNKTNAITLARRAYVESNGKAEGVEGAEDCTTKLQVTKAGTSITDETVLQVRINKGDGATDSEGNKTATYFDSANAFWNSSDLTSQLSQKATELKAGKYLLTVQARGSSNLKELVLTAGNETKTLNVQNPSNVFGSGWDDYSLETIVDNSGELNIQITGTTNVKTAWLSFNDFRLVRIGDLDAVTLDEDALTDFSAGLANVTLKRTLVADKWNTLVLPFDVAAEDAKTQFGEDAQIVDYNNSDDNNIAFNTTTEGIKANIPVLIKPTKVAGDNTYTFDGATLVEGTPEAKGTNYSFVGSYNSLYKLQNDEYMLFGDKWWKRENGDNYSVKGFRAYIKANNADATAKKLNLVIDGQTTGLKLNTIEGTVEGETYNLAGQRVAESYKGIVVKNGKKMIKK